MSTTCSGPWGNRALHHSRTDWSYAIVYLVRLVELGIILSMQVKFSPLEIAVNKDEDFSLGSLEGGLAQQQGD